MKGEPGPRNPIRKTGDQDIYKHAREGVVVRSFGVVWLAHLGRTDRFCLLNLIDPLL